MLPVFGYTKQTVTVSVGSVLKWQARPRRHVEGKLSSRVDEQHNAMVYFVHQYFITTTLATARTDKLIGN
jgi:hypothetical protein